MLLSLYCVSRMAPEFSFGLRGHGRFSLSGDSARLPIVRCHSGVREESILSVSGIPQNQGFQRRALGISAWKTPPWVKI